MRSLKENSKHKLYLFMQKAFSSREMKRISGLFLFLLFFTNALLKAEILKEGDILFGGTLLTHSSQVIKPGQFAFDQFFVFTDKYGNYDKNSELLESPNIHQYELVSCFKFGIVNDVDFSLILNPVYTHLKSHDSASLADTLLLFGLQLMREEDSLLDIRFLIGESIPTGQFDRLDPNINGIDGLGSGAFENTFILVLAKTLPISDEHAFRICADLYSGFPLATHARDHSIYGGDRGVRGKIRPGNRFIFDVGLEYNLTRRTILGLDLYYNHKNSSHFTSENRANFSGGLPSSENFSLAPCIEYNCSENFGMEAGVQFSVTGRNSPAFVSGIAVIFVVY